MAKILPFTSLDHISQRKGSRTSHSKQIRTKHSSMSNVDPSGLPTSKQMSLTQPQLTPHMYSRYLDGQMVVSLTRTYSSVRTHTSPPPKKFQYQNISQLNANCNKLNSIRCISLFSYHCFSNFSRPSKIHNDRALTIRIPLTHT